MHRTLVQIVQDKAKAVKTRDAAVAEIARFDEELLELNRLLQEHLPKSDMEYGQPSH
jgi:hypothetical protein